MTITDITGDSICNTFQECEAHIRQAIFQHPDNEIWCSSNGGPDDFPCLAILINNTLAVVNYFSKDNEEMSASIGDLSKDGEIDFCNRAYRIPRYQIIPANAALNCALEFFRSQQRPSCIEWEEL